MKRWMNGLFALALALGLGGVALEADAAAHRAGPAAAALKPAAAGSAAREVAG